MSILSDFLGMIKREKILKLRKKRNELWKKFCDLQKKGSFAGLSISGDLNRIQQKLDELEGSRPSKRYYTEINIEVS